MDAVWEPEAEKNLPTGYERNTAGVDVGFNILKKTTLILGYTYDKIKRTHREASKTEDDIYKVSLNTTPIQWLTLGTSYEYSERDGDYDYRVPFEGETVTPQLPWLRKYDQAKRDRDRVQLLLTLTPVEIFSITGSYIYGKDDFKDSPFGLLSDEHNIYSLNLDLTPTERIAFYAFYSYEEYKNKQKARQWNPGGFSDPYTGETTYESNSNWETEFKDKVNTFGAGVEVGIVPKKLGFKLGYTFTKTNGLIDLSSPLGTAANDMNAWTPLSFTKSDDTKLHALNAELNYELAKKGLTLAIGYTWEKWEIEDFAYEGYTNIPVTSAGAYTGGLLMRALEPNYEAHVGYLKLSYKF